MLVRFSMYNDIYIYQYKQSPSDDAPFIIDPLYDAICNDECSRVSGQTIPINPSHTKLIGQSSNLQIGGMDQVTTIFLLGDFD